ncbi:MAG: DNA-processing protein DprA [bacterium]
MDSARIHKEDKDYPTAFLQYLGRDAPDEISAIGNVDILRGQKTALFCSVKCPGNIILRTYDLVKKWREEGVTVIGGFHSPMEQECLSILLRGRQPVILCPARSIERMRLQAEHKGPIRDGRLLLLSPFVDKQKRATSASAMERNRFVAALADEILIPYAAGNSKTEHLCRELLTWEKPVCTFYVEANSNLVALGVRNHELYITPYIMQHSL